MKGEHSAASSDWLATVRKAVDAELDRRLELPRLGGDTDTAAPLREAIRYAGLGAGKRLRPALAIAASEAAGGSLQDALPVACAVEMLHAYTLVHDDLPAMDDDDERRGRPTVHVAFGEAIAILAGDALLGEAFLALADLGERAADGVRVLATRGGSEELLAGQARDLAAERSGAELDWAALEEIHRAKTGALFAAAAELGGISAGADDDARARLAEYGMAVGIAFQHGDDRLDDEHERFRHRAAESVRTLAARAGELASSFGERGARLQQLVKWIAVRD